MELQHGEEYFQKQRDRIIRQMSVVNPHMSLRDVGEIAYKIDPRPPEEVLRQGFLPQNDSVTIVRGEHSANDGLVAFSLIPEAAALSSKLNRPLPASRLSGVGRTGVTEFPADQSKDTPSWKLLDRPVTDIGKYRARKIRQGVDEYIYAVPVDQAYLVEGQKRQILAPALPPPAFLVARKVISNNGTVMTLGEPERFGGIPEKFIEDETFRQFQEAPRLAIPQDIALGDENYPAQFNIKDTPASSRLFSRRDGGPER